jgi:hypothetical protein
LAKRRRCSAELTTSKVSLRKVVDTFKAHAHVARVERELRAEVAAGAFAEVSLVQSSSRVRQLVLRHALSMCTTTAGRDDAAKVAMLRAAVTAELQGIADLVHALRDSATKLKDSYRQVVEPFTSANLYALAESLVAAGRAQAASGDQLRAVADAELRAVADDAKRRAEADAERRAWAEAERRARAEAVIAGAAMRGSAAPLTRGCLGLAGCRQTPSSSCANGMCRTCCPGCVRHRK